MAQRSFLGDILTTLFERRAGAASAQDGRSIQDMCRALLTAAGEVSGLYLAKAILETYSQLDADGKRGFFEVLNEDLEIDTQALNTALEQFTETRSPADYRAVATAAEPKRQELLRRLNQSPGATRALVQMRTDLLGFLETAPALQRTDLDFRHLLRSWFNRGFLVLRQISWETPASILEKIVEYEAVHAINDWDDLRRRLYPPDRRCFAYFHPTMPDEPLIFVEVALTLNVPNSIQHVLADSRELRDTADTKVAVFYSISNCQKGLQGISFGNLLIKQVVDELRQEFSDLETFVTLSPIPRLNTWLATQPDDPMAQSVLNGTASDEDIRDTAATYLLTAKTERGTPFDPVARFHLGNGAQIYAVHADADLSENGLAQSSGAMVNYHYDLAQIERNHERFVQDGDVSTAPEFTQSHQRRKSKSQK
jgi:malonyl-CoA decarboxylase